MGGFDQKLLKNIVEGLLLASSEPMPIKRIVDIFLEHESSAHQVVPTTEEIRSALDSIALDCDGRGYELQEVATGWHFQVRQELATWIGRLWEEKPVKYSRAILETLALVAYRQPITRGDIEDIRGVAVSSSIIKTLMERQWVRVVGHRDVPGRPALFATTRQFLDYFNLKSLEELPSLGEIRDIGQINAELDFEQGKQLAQILVPRLPETDNAESESEAEEQGALQNSVSDANASECEGIELI